MKVWWRRRRGEALESSAPGDEPLSGDDSGRVRRFVDRHGVKGLGIVGPTFPGVTASVAGGLAMGLDGRQLGKWMSIGIVLMYTLYTVGLMVLVELFQRSRWSLRWRRNGPAIARRRRFPGSRRMVFNRIPLA